MNKYQRKEARMIKRMHNDVDLIGMPFDFDHYKAFRRGIRKTARMLIKANQKAHKEALSNAVNDYARVDLFNTVCIAEPIEVKNE